MLVIYWNYTEMNGHQNIKKKNHVTFILMTLFHLLKDITKISLNSIKILLRPHFINLPNLSLHP